MEIPNSSGIELLSDFPAFFTGSNIRDCPCYAVIIHQSIYIVGAAYRRILTPHNAVISAKRSIIEVLAGWSNLTSVVTVSTPTASNFSFTDVTNACHDPFPRDRASLHCYHRHFRDHGHRWCRDTELGDAPYMFYDVSFGIFNKPMTSLQLRQLILHHDLLLMLLLSAAS